ncbi:response regulator [Luteitalea sp.]|uniref:response regulator n=1 Tax=Luteitalea sp. TaxID=2004800 RepID=UPI00345A5B3C
MSARILVVEDDLVVAETLEVYLERAGYGVRLTRDGRDGLALAQSGDFALVVLDLMSPGLSGLDVCRELRRTSRVDGRQAARDGGRAADEPHRSDREGRRGPALNRGDPRGRRGTPADSASGRVTWPGRAAG